MSDADKLRRGLAAIVGGEIEGLDIMGSHTYRVTKVYPEGRCDLAPVEPRMEALPKVDQWLGGGEVTTPVVGALCCVEFRDLKRDRPIITRWQPLRVTGGTPTKAAIDATAIEFGGASAVPLATAAQLTTWAGLVNGALSALAVPIAPLGAIATTKVKGV